MHTNDTASTITRLLDMGIELYLLSSSVVGVIAQRLVRKICDNCKTVDRVDSSDKERFHIPPDQILYFGTGCNHCNQTGYKGRTAIHEVMLIDDDIKKMIDHNEKIATIRKAAVERGMTFL